MKQVPIPVLFVSFEQNLIHLPQGWEIGIYRRKKGSKQESNHALDHKKRRRKEAGQEIRKHALVHEKRTRSRKQALDQESVHEKNLFKKKR